MLCQRSSQVAVAVDDGLKDTTSLQVCACMVISKSRCVELLLSECNRCTLYTNVQTIHKRTDIM